MKPVLINAFGSARRMNIALGVDDIEDIAKGIDRYLKIAPPATLMDKVKLLPLLLNAANFPPKMVGAERFSGSVRSILIFRFLAKIIFRVPRKDGRKTKNQ